MVAKKQIIILNGGGHKGIVKISGVTGKTDTIKVSCSLDFRPNNAKLYIIGDNVAQMALNNTNCEDEIAFSAKGEVGCVLRSSSITMFGGSGSKSDMLKKIESANAQTSKTQEHIAQGEIKAEKSQKSDAEVKSASETKRGGNTTANEVRAASVEDEDDKEEIKKKHNGKETRAYVGAATAANALGEWTKYDGNNFYYAVKPQIDEMFVCYPEETLLNDTVPNSKWVRVEADDGYYVVGLLYDEDEPSFICYGVPQLKTDGQVKAPAELENMCVWLPISSSENITGYWIIYQSAKTGEIIK